MAAQGEGGPGPLSGLRVLELGQIAAGPFAGSLLADLGADVVKVERPDGGDGMRAWPPLSAGEAGTAAFSENFASLNRNKRSVAFDLKDPQDLARLVALAAVADVLVENFRSGVLDRLGLGYEALSSANPRLVYCSISGYGRAGPLSSRGAFDVTVQAMSGVMSVTGEEGGAPVKCGVPIGDFCAGLYAAFTILAAVLAARCGGRGAHLDCSMLGSLIGVSALQTSEYFGTGRAPRALGSAHPRNAPYQAFRASDDWLVVAAGNDRLWLEVCRAVGAPELAQDPRFDSQERRAANQGDLVALLEPQFATRSAAEWLEEMDRRGVPCAPINSYPEILASEQLQAMELVRPLLLPNGAATRTTAFPVAISGSRFEIRRGPPELGEHNDEVLEEWLAVPVAGRRGEPAF